MFDKLFSTKPLALPSRDQALPGRAAALEAPPHHFVLNRPLQPPYPEGAAQILLGMGCFWGAERALWRLGEGIHITAVGYAGGFTPHPTYEEVCSGRTGHNEVVLVVHDPEVLPLTRLLAAFWEGHDPTQGMRQGNDRGTQYRSGIYTFSDAQQAEAEASRSAYAKELSAHGHGPITTEILSAGPFYFAEGYHQQYLAKNPNGYCGLGGTGVACPIGLGAASRR